MHEYQARRQVVQKLIENFEVEARRATEQRYVRKFASMDSSQEVRQALDEQRLTNVTKYKITRLWKAKNS